MIVPCPNCHASVDAQEIGSTIVDGWTGDTGDYVFLRCRKCDRPIVMKMDLKYPDLDTGPERGSRGTRVYPAPPRVGRPGVPAQIDASINEAHVCFEAGAYLACAVMCRRTLETLTAHHLPKAKGTLAKRVETLHKDGVINDTLAAWAKALREDGNLAAHEPEAQLDAGDARPLLEFSEALVDFVFVLNARFKQFEERRAKRKAAPTTGNP